MTGATKIAYSAHKGQFHYAVTSPGKWALYNIREDRAQENDLAHGQPDVVARMSEAYDIWWDAVSSELR
jgi:hypothetical protein